MKNLYVLSDIHGDYEAMEGVLLNAGLLIHKQGRGYVKKRDAFVVQIGDLANCVYDSVDNDLRCLTKVGSWIDLILVGNHEMPYFDRDNRFSGFHPDLNIHNLLWGLHDSRLLLPSYCHNGTLITHAGITQQQLNFGTGTTAEEVHSKLAREWADKDFNHYLFRDCGQARYGRAEVGGVLWCDFDKEFEPTEFPQIVGHTGGVLRTKGNAICIDTQRTSGPTVMKVG